ncbi:hypothetical protein ACFVYT_32755 [Streptomyces sp. NPDC058290]|uniref:hypothetical protein n=1 Tax=Streptomyces sp. NPDC058290 TaxID=3346426 RepID=UPI0036F148AB
MRSRTTSATPGTASGGARGTIGGTYPLWQRHRYARSKTFPRLHVVLAGVEEHLLETRRTALTAAVHGPAIAVRVNTLPGSSATSPGTRSASKTRTGAAPAVRPGEFSARPWLADGR